MPTPPPGVVSRSRPPAGTRPAPTATTPTSAASNGPQHAPKPGLPAERRL
ncbi:hypothetical protein Ae406Ps2_6418c [Pseudonocardia sp. Ae406_Ps2]|nr:hypothetical protein Ae406Ps2_6418c [Pseudonocardia sp. Ae406_Ps2]